MHDVHYSVVFYAVACRSGFWTSAQMRARDKNQKKKTSARLCSLHACACQRNITIVVVVAHAPHTQTAMATPPVGHHKRMCDRGEVCVLQLGTCAHSANIHQTSHKHAHVVYVRCVVQVRAHSRSGECRRITLITAHTHTWPHMARR